MKLAIRSLIACLPLALAGCGGDDTGQMEAAVRKTVLHERALAAGFVFFSCKPDGDTAMCENCDMTVYEKDGALIGYATHWSHKLRQTDGKWKVVVSGEHNLLGVQDFGQDMGSLRKLFDLFERKTELMRLLDTSSRAEGVRIFIGGESQVVPYEELSIVSAPYEVDGQVVGTLGVIGPTRMAYDRMIQIVDITARLVGNALSQR